MTRVELTRVVSHHKITFYSVQAVISFDIQVQFAKLLWGWNTKFNKITDILKENKKIN